MLKHIVKTILSYGKKITLNPMIRYTKDHLMLRIIKIMLKITLQTTQKFMLKLMLKVM